MWFNRGMLETDLIPSETPSQRLLVVLHGLGDSMEGYRWLPEGLRLPWLNYLLVNAPDDYYGGFSWYDFAQDAGPGVHRSREMLFELLEDCEKRGFAPEATGLFGFSQGCLMTLEAGLRYPKKLAALVGISGYVHDAAKLIRELSPAAREEPILLTHGTFDPMIPIEKVRPQVAQLKQAGLRIEWREFRKEHTIAGEEELKVIREFLARSFGVAQEGGSPAARP